MKATLTKLVLAATLSLTAAFAQSHSFDDNENSAAVTADPATVVANRVAYLKALLTLTDAQVTAATKLFTDEVTAETAARASLTTARTALTAAIKANSTSSIASLSAQIGTIEGQLTLADATADAGFYALLTADQKTKYDALASRGGGHGQHH
jgi:Spy/CpxP family protein refolding chaperone